MFCHEYAHIHTRMYYLPHFHTLISIRAFFCMTEVQPIVCNVIPTANNGK